MTLVICKMCAGLGHDNHYDPNGEPNPSKCRNCDGEGMHVVEGGQLHHPLGRLGTSENTKVIPRIEEDDSE